MDIDTLSPEQLKNELRKERQRVEQLTKQITTSPASGNYFVSSELNVKGLCLQSNFLIIQSEICERASNMTLLSSTQTMVLMQPSTEFHFLS